MNKSLPKTLFFCFCLIYSLTASHLYADSVKKEPVETAELITQLQSGGHIIYMRHGPTDHSQNDDNKADLENCEQQRNLSREGRELMVEIGEKITALNIPIGSVLSSPYCRCRNTAELVFGKFEVEHNLRFSIHKDKEESRQLGEKLYQMMQDTPVDNSNTVLVGHTSNLRDGLGIWPKPEGVAVIFEKQDSQLVYKGMIKPDIWSTLK